MKTISCLTPITTLALGIALALPVSQPVIAQDEDGLLEEITVTARRRDESLLDIPLTVSAFSADAIEKAGFNTINDLITAVPGVTSKLS